MAGGAGSCLGRSEVGEDRHSSEFRQNICLYTQLCVEYPAIMCNRVLVLVRRRPHGKVGRVLCSVLTKGE